MGRHDPDSWSNSVPESRSRAEAPREAPEDCKPRTAASVDGPRNEPRPAAASSLMSVQIRRTRAPRKRAPCGFSPCGPAETPETRASAPATRASDPAAQRPATRAPGNGAARRGGEITAYWTRLRGRQAYPAVSDLDPDRIAAGWPNSILFRCRAGSGALMPDMSFLPRQEGGKGPSADDGKIQLSPMMLQWLVSLAEDAVRNQRPVEDVESFPSTQRAIGYRAVALPLSDNGSEIDHVLCHVKQS